MNNGPNTFMQRLDNRIYGNNPRGDIKFRYIGLAPAVEGFSSATRKISSYFKDRSDGQKIMKN